MNMFWIDQKRGTQKSYSELIHELNGKSGCKRYIYLDDPYRIYLELIHSLIHGYEVELLDAQLSLTEIRNLGLDTKNMDIETRAETGTIGNFEELCARIEQAKDTWRVAIYTSGTTGRPKKVIHTLDTITRSVKRGPQFRQDRWAFTYNPTHFAGLQVFFQAFFNQNPFIYLFESDRNLINPLLIHYSVTHISATPTYYRMLLPYMEQAVPSVKRITVGGEKFDPLMTGKLSTIFPNAKLRNIYASTEAGSLFGSEGETFSIASSLKDLVQVSADGELLLHRKLLAASDVLVGDWYHTGDMIQFVDQDRFIFAGRTTEMINVGGYKVNPHEVEEEMKKVEGVLDVLVSKRMNRITGNIVTAEIVSSGQYLESELETRIRIELSSKLQEWKIPRIIRFVKEIPKTRTGKKVRS